MRNTPAPNTRYVALSRNCVYHLPCPASVSVWLLLFPPAPTPRTQTADAPSFSILQFPSDSTIFSISTRTSHSRSNSVTSAASSLVNYIGLTIFQAFTTGQILATTKKPSRLKHATVPYFAAVIRRVQPISCGCFNNL